MDWKVSIIPTTVPKRPKSGATAASNFMVLRFCSRTGTALDKTSSSCASRSSGVEPVLSLKILFNFPKTELSEKLPLSSSASSTLDAAEASQSEFAGVNLDEEAAHLLEFQQAYQASARILQTAKEMFQSLIVVV